MPVLSGAGEGLAGVGVLLVIGEMLLTIDEVRPTELGMLGRKSDMLLGNGEPNPVPDWA